MKSIVLFFLSAICVCSTCAQSQAEENIQADQLHQAAESRLQQTILTIQGLYNTDPQFLRCLKESQQAWLIYRKKQIAMIYPHQNEKGRPYGTVFPLCWSTWMTKLTQQRTAELQVWIDGIEEGEVCAGSIRITQPVAGN
jgi:uncharacterized protein YecT (DUF1311 family)